MSTAEAPLAALTWSGTSALDVYLARERGTGADNIAAVCAGAGQIAVPIGQLAGLLAEFAADHVQLETSPMAPLVIRDSAKLGLICRSQWDFGKEGTAGLAVA